MTKITTTPGGVARNMVEAVKKLGHDPMFLSAVGGDLFGRELLLRFQQIDIDHSTIMQSEQSSSAIYSTLLNKCGECLFGMGDMNIHDEIKSDYILNHSSEIEAAPIVILDANVPVHTISTVLKICSSSKTPVWFEPTEIRKSQKICNIPTSYLRAITYISPNIRELQSILHAASRNGVLLDNRKHRLTFKGSRPPSHLNNNPVELEAVVGCFQLFPELEMVLLTKGSDGIVVTFKDKSDEQLDSFAYSAPRIHSDDIVSVSGAGDCLNAGVISSILNGKSWLECARIGTECATQSLKSLKNVPDVFPVSRQ